MSERGDRPRDEVALKSTRSSSKEQMDKGSNKPAKRFEFTNRTKMLLSTEEWDVRVKAQDDKSETRRHSSDHTNRRHQDSNNLCESSESRQCAKHMGSGNECYVSGIRQEVQYSKQQRGKTERGQNDGCSWSRSEATMPEEHDRQDDDRKTEV